jgi:hypothetical protein
LEPTVPEIPEISVRSRSVWPLLSVVVLLFMGAAVLAVLFLWRQSGPSTAPAARPASTAPSIGFVVRDLQLRDGGRELTVTWAALPVTVVVALSRAGGAATVLGTVPPGTGEYVVRGIDPKAAYCVVLGPVDEAVSITPATSACTVDR